MAKGTRQTVTILGRIGTEPDINVKNDNVIARLNIATVDAVRNRETNEFEDKTTWLRVTFFGKQAEFCRDYINKGDTVDVEARLRNSKWMDKEGNERSGLDIIGRNVQLVGRRDTSNADSSLLVEMPENSL